MPITIAALLVGSVWGLLFAPTDYKQGDSYRIIYIHVPAAVVALAGYYVMALAGLVSLVWRVKLADTAMRLPRPLVPRIPRLLSLPGRSGANQRGAPGGFGMRGSRQC